MAKVKFKNKAAQALARMRKPENMKRGNSEHYRAIALKRWGKRK